MANRDEEYIRKYKNYLSSEIHRDGTLYIMVYPITNEKYITIV